MFLVRKHRPLTELNKENITRIQATSGWGSLNLDELWEYRDLIYFLMWREINGRYKQMALGSLWLVLQPFYTIILISEIYPYDIQEILNPEFLCDTKYYR